MYGILTVGSDLPRVRKGILITSSGVFLIGIMDTLSTGVDFNGLMFAMYFFIAPLLLFLVRDYVIEKEAKRLLLEHERRTQRANAMNETVTRLGMMSNNERRITKTPQTSDIKLEALDDIENYKKAYLPKLSEVKRYVKYNDDRYQNYYNK